MAVTEQQRQAALAEAERQAAALFDTIAAEVIRPGATETQLSRECHALGAERHGVRTHWHKRVVRSGPNTLEPYGENPPDRVVEAGDILFVDLGPVFEEWEADYGRTYVVPLRGSSGAGTESSEPTPLTPEEREDQAAKERLRDALEPAWDAVKARFEAAPDSTTGGELYGWACEAAREAGYEFGGRIAGHVIGQFPHERIPRDQVTLYITADNDKPVKTSVDDQGRPRHWILEIHFVDRQRQIGGFMEKILTVG